MSSSYMGTIHNNIESVGIIFTACSCVNITVFGSHQVFNEMIYLRFFKYGAFHVSVSHRRPNLILHTITKVYPHVNFMNKGLSIVQ